MKRLGPHILLACTPTVIVISVVAALGLVFLVPEPDSLWIVLGVPIALATAMWVGFWLTYRPISVDIGRGVLWFKGAEHLLADVHHAEVSTWGSYTILRLEATGAGVSALIAGGPVFPLSGSSRVLLADALERSGIVDPPPSVRIPNIGIQGARYGFTWRSAPVSLSRSDAAYFLTGKTTADPPMRAIEVVRTGRTIARRTIWVASSVLVLVALFLGMLALLTM